ncbi:anthranilate synthase component I [Desulfogranum japonicum]|uniref:anthranilate synthase component I n=1 Tax=Desulfogranum japonicum TaxID=231447 RepID=UPI0003FC2D33|nr:anthranilate synthase component I [Desulfogranum japonicum]
MYFPTESDFSAMLDEADLVPLYRTIIADLDTPLTIFAKVAGTKKHAFLFESMEGGEKWGRYSFIGLDPLATITSLKDSFSVVYPDNPDADVHLSGVNPLRELQKLLGSLNVPDSSELPRFYGGAVGFMGYDMIRFIEEIPDQHPVGSTPDSAFMIPGMVLIHDSVEQSLTIVCNVRKQDSLSAQELYKRGCGLIDEVEQCIKGPVPDNVVEQGKPVAAHDFHSNMEPEIFHNMVNKAKEYILAGDVIQVVLSQRFHSKTNLNPFVLYRALRHINPSPYLFYVRHDDLVLIGSSPEILVRLEGREIELRPIAGTRKRGKDLEDDLALEKELLADPKERAEHLMLVDLGRNDVGRVAEAGSVRVDDLLVIERYSHVMHIVSGVRGTLKSDLDQFDVFEACFPAGTVSGAPKIRAMEIIDELEVERRGPYAGAVGYFGFSGNMDFCITIRTFVVQDNTLWVQAGAGIVADSDPNKEFEETVNKSMALRKAVELAEQGF